MPELPEVETVVRGLRRHILGETFGAVSFASRRVGLANARGWKSRTNGEQVGQIARLGKYIIVRFTSGNALVIHLRMTGRLWIKPPSYHRERHDRFVLPLTDGRQLVLSDARQFGRIDWLEPYLLERHRGISKLGPDALTITKAQFAAICSKSHRPIKSFLLDQTRLAGLGNIYADESLFAARIHPEAFTDSISPHRLERLRLGMITILQNAIDACGTTFDTFSDLEGEAGGFSPQLKVYQRTGMPCADCRSAIRRIVLSGRSTHFCPRCQKF